MGSLFRQFGISPGSGAPGLTPIRLISAESRAHCGSARDRPGAALDFSDGVRQRIVCHQFLNFPSSHEKEMVEAAGIEPVTTLP
jgi:hypothetical protein